MKNRKNIKRIAIAATIDKDILSKIKLQAQKENLPVSRIIEKMVCMGYDLNSKMPELKERLRNLESEQKKIQKWLDKKRVK